MWIVTSFKNASPKLECHWSIFLSPKQLLRKVFAKSQAERHVEINKTVTKQDKTPSCANNRNSWEYSYGTHFTYMLGEKLKKLWPFFPIAQDCPSGQIIKGSFQFSTTRPCCEDIRKRYWNGRKAGTMKYILRKAANTEWRFLKAETMDTRNDRDGESTFCKQFSVYMIAK